MDCQVAGSVESILSLLLLMTWIGKNEEKINTDGAEVDLSVCDVMSLYEQEDKWDLKLTARSPQDKQTRFREKIPPLQQKGTPSRTCIATGNGKSHHHNANCPKLWPSRTIHGVLMVVQQLRAS